MTTSIRILVSVVSAFLVQVALSQPNASETQVAVPVDPVEVILSPPTDAETSRRAGVPTTKQNLNTPNRRPVSGGTPGSTPPALRAAQKSSAWADRADASVVSGDDGRVVVIYGESVPKIVCAPLRVCSIELEPGEVVNKVDAGDSVRWKITPSIVGSGPGKTVHLVIKPVEPDIRTNLKIATDRRMYDLDLHSVRGAEYVRRVAFYYPENEARAWAAHKAQAENENSMVTAELAPMSIDKLNFSYLTEGEGVAKPVRVFDDGLKTYIQMPAELKSTEAPVLVLIGQDGREQLVNYRLKNGYYMVDRLIDKAALLAGGGRVTITRDVCKKRGWFGACAE